MAAVCCCCCYYESLSWSSHETPNKLANNCSQLANDEQQSKRNLQFPKVLHSNLSANAKHLLNEFEFGQNCVSALFLRQAKFAFANFRRFLFVVYFSISASGKCACASRRLAKWSLLFALLEFASISLYLQIRRLLFAASLAPTRKLFRQSANANANANCNRTFFAFLVDWLWVCRLAVCSGRLLRVRDPSLKLIRAQFEKFSSRKGIRQKGIRVCGARNSSAQICAWRANN